MGRSARALLEDLPQKPLLFVDAAWRLMREDSWEKPRRSDTIIGLVTRST